MSQPVPMGTLRPKDRLLRKLLGRGGAWPQPQGLLSASGLPGPAVPAPLILVFIFSGEFLGTADSP